MPYHVAESAQCPASKPWACLKTGTGKVMGCHPTKADAEKQMAALYANEPGAKQMSADDCGCHGPAGRAERGSVDGTPWDGPAAMSACSNSAAPASCFSSICAGKKAGDTATQDAWALPHHKHPGSPPNAAGVRNALARLPQTQGLTNRDAARAHLEAHMTAIQGAGQNAPSRPSEARAQAYQGTRRGPTAEAARLEPFAATWQHRGAEISGKQFAQLDGYASVTGIEYEMWDAFGAYGETIAPDAFNATLAAQPDVAFLVNHKGLTMARTKNPSGDPTLILDSDPRGLHSRAYLNPERNDVHDLLLAIDDKNVTEMSFAFMLEDGEWDEDFEHFTVTRCNIDRGDVSAVNYGANPYTSIGARSRQILADLGHLPAGAQRAAFDRLSAALGTSRTIPALAEDAGCAGEVAQAARDYQDSLTPLDTTPKGRSVAFYETMLRL